jgi:hypothetical protein
MTASGANNPNYPLTSNDMNAAFMSFQQHDRGIHVVCSGADVASD